MCDVEIFNENHGVRNEEKTNSPVSFQDEIVTSNNQNEKIVVEVQTKGDLEIQENINVTEVIN